MEGLLAYLDFSIPEQPCWRKESNTAPTISEMITDIAKYVNTYENFKHSKTKTDAIRQAKRALLMEFLLNVQQAEGVGVKTEEETREIIDRLDLQNEELEFVTDKSSSDTNEISFTTFKTEESPPICESYPSIEEEIPKAYESIASIAQGAPLKSVRETENLYKAYCDIVQLIKHASTKIKDKRTLLLCVGLMEIQTCVIDLHRTLMDNVMVEEQIPGRFSTNRRVTKFRGKVHNYPYFEDEDIAHSTVEYLIDRYNEIVDKANQNASSDIERYYLSFKCASVFLFSFLFVHPFPDGNGRLARLLTSYSLLTFSQFMTPIYNVFSTSTEDDYIDALVKARKNLTYPPNISDENSGFQLVNTLLNQQPSDLCAMLIESNWAAWRQLLYRIGDKSIVLYPWEKPVPVEKPVSG